MTAKAHTVVEAIHAAVSNSARRLEVLHGEALTCRRGCHDCCVDDISVFEVEAARITSSYAELLARGKPHPLGGCAFLDEEGGCRIYQARPYVCRTQGLPLRWIDDGPDGEPVEYRDVCPLNEEQLALTELEPEACWTLGRTEGLLQQAQQQATGDLRRISLRSLFVR